jgi:gas vesicle protein
MNDTKQENASVSMLMPMVGFALGAAVGAGLALLLAPASGEHTRRRLGNAARRMSRDTQHNLKDVRDNLSEAARGLGGNVQAAIQAGRDAIRHDGALHGALTTAKSGVAPETPGTRTP